VILKSASDNHLTKHFIFKVHPVSLFNPVIAMDGVYAGFAGAKTCLYLSILIYKYYVMIMFVSTHKFLLLAKPAYTPSM